MHLPIRFSLRTACFALITPCCAGLLALACSASPTQEADRPVVVTQPTLGEPAQPPGSSDAGVQHAATDAAGEEKGMMWGSDVGDRSGTQVVDPDGPPPDGGAQSGSMAVVTIVRSDSDGGALGIGGPKGPPPPRVRTGQPSVQGNLPPELISRTIRHNFGYLRSCYQKGLAKNPKLSGRITFRFVIEKDGSVRNVTSSGDLPDQDVNRCAARGIKRLTFPPPGPPGTVTVSYPIVFTPDAAQK